MGYKTVTREWYGSRLFAQSEMLTEEILAVARADDFHKGVLAEYGAAEFWRWTDHEHMCGLLTDVLLADLAIHVEECGGGVLESKYILTYPGWEGCTLQWLGRDAPDSLPREEVDRQLVEAARRLGLGDIEPDARSHTYTY